MDNKELARYIDLTLLKPGTTSAQIYKLCEQAHAYGTYGACVNSAQVSRVRTALAGSSVKTVSVVGFPLGANASAAKAYEAYYAVVYGRAEEIDMVMNLDAFNSGDYSAVHRDIEQVVKACGSVPVKVIIESAALSIGEIVRACLMAEEAGAKFVKTSTGFHPAGGATVEAVGLMHRTVGGRLGIKASGKVDSRAFALALIEAGATRIGAGVDNAHAILDG